MFGVFRFPCKPPLNQNGYTCYSWVTLGLSISFSDVCLAASLDLVLASPSVQWLCRLESLAGDLEQVTARRSALSLILLEAPSMILRWTLAGFGRPMPDRRKAFQANTLHAPCAAIGLGATSIRMLARNGCCIIALGYKCRKSSGVPRFRQFVFGNRGLSLSLVYVRGLC